LTLLVNVVVMGLGISLALIYVSRGWDPLIVSLWPAVLLIYLELMILTGVALLFSSFSSPALSALLTFFIFIIGHLSADLKSLSVSLGSTGARWLFTGLYYLLPNLANYSYITPTAHGRSPSAGFVASVAVYAVVYITVILAVATLVFSRRNFK
jgi:ABC-type transport system involved in multi-copper enzyme maturation permease subunit